MYLIVIIAIAILLFIFLRGVTLWYFMIEERRDLLKSNNK